MIDRRTAPEKAGPMATCIGPECARAATRAGLCPAHYMQKRRGVELKPLRTGDESAQITFRCSPNLKKDSERAAKREGVDPAEWWRRAGVARLGQ